MAGIYFLAIFSFSYSQDLEDYSEFLDFHKVSYIIQGNVYFKAKSSKDYGSYNLKNNNSFRPRIGIDYHINPEKEISFRTGFYIDWIPLYNIDLNYKPEDIPEEYRPDPSYNIQSEIFEKTMFSFPLLVDFKKRIGENVIFNSSFGFELSYLSSGRVEVYQGFVDNTINEYFEMFGMYADTTSNNIYLYPGVRVSPGLYILTNKILYHFEMNYCYKLSNLLEGEYQFGNLYESEPTRGPYTFRGSYLGFGLSLNFKKKKKITSANKVFIQ